MAGEVETRAGVRYVGHGETVREERAEAHDVPLARAVPGRDLAVFLLLLFVLDATGILHIYGINFLYNEYLFLGAGLLVVAFALLLLPDDLLSRVPWRRLRAVFVVKWAAFSLACAGLVVVAAFLLVTATAHPPDWWPRDPNLPIDPNEQAWGLPIMIGVMVAAPLLALLTAYSRRDFVRRLLLSAFGAAAFTLSLANLFFSDGLGNNWAPNTWAAMWGAGWETLFAVAAVAAAAIALTFAPSRVFMVVALGAALVVRLLAFGAVKVDVSHGDMLPLVQMAADRVLNLQDPYIIYKMPWDLPLTYWPLTVLTYVPFRALALDMRWANLLIAPALAAMLWRRGGPRGAAHYALGLLYLTPSMMQWDLITAAQPYWLWLAAALWLAVARTPWPGVGVGLALASGPLALPFAPFLFSTWLRRGYKQVLANVAAAAVVGLVVVGPFLLANFGGFWQGAVMWFNDVSVLPKLKWDTDRTWLYEVGVAGPFWINGLEQWLKVAQLAILGALFALSLSMGTKFGAPTAIRWGVAAYLLFMAFNPVIWPYLYVPALIGMLFVLSTSGGTARAQGDGGTLHA